MIDDFGGGSPPAMAEVEKELARDRSNFIQRDLNKGTAADLDSEEQLRVSDYLGEERLKLYAEASRNLFFYADPSAFGLPEDPFSTKIAHGLDELYDWHWNWWIAEDIIAAIARANTRPDGTPIPVISAPVKRLVSVTTLSPAVGAAQQGNNAGRGGAGRTVRGNNARGSAAAGSGPSGPLGEPNVSLDVAVQPDYAVSLTGRKTNALFDVRTVEVVVVVETAMLPALVDALAQENFVTITDLSLRPDSAFKAAEFGYMFGAEPVSRVRLTLETIWFRKWTAPWMPQPVRDALGIQAAAGGSKG